MNDVNDVNEHSCGLMSVLLCSYRPNNIYPGCGADVTEEILQQVPHSVYCQIAQNSLYCHYTGVGEQVEQQ